MKQFVKDYEIIFDIPDGEFNFYGGGVAYKELAYHIFNNKRKIKVLDIGFGMGHLGYMIKSNPDTKHWEVDGIDGHLTTCYNKELFSNKYYRNIFHGYAQDLTVNQLKDYDLICLLDVIEHLDVKAANSLLRILLSSLNDKSFLFLSTPMFFMPQTNLEAGDLEEHLIGIPASSLMTLMPKMYKVYAKDILVGNFIYGKESLDYIDFFTATDDKSFDIQKGYKIAKAVGMNIHEDIITITNL